MLLLRGLGASSVNTGVIKQTGTIPGRGTVPAPVIESDKTARFFTFEEVRAFKNEFYWYDPEAKAEVDYVRSLTSTFPPCPPSSFSTNGKFCYTGNITSSAGLMPGTISIFGALFHVSEINQYGQLVRRYRPTRPQRIPIEWQIIDLSMSSLRAAFKKLAGTGFYSLGFDEMLTRALPKFKLRIDNFGLNSIQPTATERVSKNGFKSWFDRGGFLIDMDLVEGRTPLQKNLVLSYCASTICNCNNQAPSCIRGFITKKGELKPGTRLETSDLSLEWNVYLKVNRDGTYEIGAINQDGPSWYQKLAAHGGDFLLEVGRLYCGSRPDQLIDNKICVDANKARCSEGTPGCKCTALPAAPQATKDFYSGVTSKLCADFMIEHAPPRTWETPPAKFEVPPDSTAVKIPWWAVVAGGLVVGAAVFSKRGG